MKTYDVFLSHNSQDKPLVEKIGRWLEDDANLVVWLDKWNLIPGDPWQEGLENALDDSKCCAVFLGPNGIGVWQNEEMRSALDERVSKKSIRVIPVLLPGADRPQKESELPRFLRRLTWVEFREDWQEEEALHRLMCGVKCIPPGRAAGERLTDICPYRGLEVFREEDWRFFYGRDAVTQRLMDRLNSWRFLAVLGPSGSGKSSVVQAGLIPQFRETILITLLNPRERPVEELAFALRTCYETKPPTEELIKRLKDSEDGLHIISREIVGSVVAAEGLLIVIDQFEELFTQTRSEEERRQFLAVILKAVETSNGPTSVILTMRTDFLGKCAFYPDLNTFINDHFIQLEPMNRDELRSAIEEPAHLAGLVCEEGLVERVLNDIEGAPGELPLLEHALLELYGRRQGIQLTLQAYQEIGGIEGALSKRAETEYGKLDDTEKETIRKMFVLRLIQPGEGTEDTRRSATKEELLAVGEEPHSAELIIKKWTDARLLTSALDASRGQILVDVAHEALIRKWDKMQNWMADNREEARLIGNLRQAAQEWQRSGRNPDYLFLGARLSQMEDLRKAHATDITPLENQFVEAGLSQREKQKREKEKSRQKELQTALDLAAANARAVKRSRIIVLVVSLALVLVGYFAYKWNLNQKMVRTQLARNYWENGRHEREQNHFLLSLYLYAEAIKVNPDESLKKNILFEIKNYQPQISLLNILQHENVVLGAIFNKDETRILTWSKDSTARLWDAQSGEQIGPALQHKGAVSGAIFNKDETRILTWSRDDTARLWDAQSGEQIGPALQHKGAVSGAIFNKDETRILTWSRDDTARLWDAQSGEQIGPALQHKGAVSGAIFNKDETRILTWSRDDTARLWDAQSGEQIGPALQHKDAVRGAIFNKDETRILTWSEDSTARLWDAQSGEQIGPALQHKSAVSGAIFNKDETRILTWSLDDTARLWDAQSGEQIGPALQHKYPVMGAIFNKDETRILTRSLDDTARLWDAQSGKQIGPALQHKGPVNGAIFNKDETRILTWSEDGTARLWEAQSGEQIGPALQHKGAVWGAIFNKDETRILTWSKDSTARLWDAQSGEQIGPALQHKDDVWGAIFNKDETRILTRSLDDTARLWDAQSGKQIGPALQHKGAVSGAIFNKDETRILTWSIDSTARLWDAQSGEQIGPALQHKDDVWGAIFNKDETRILTRSLDDTARLWDAQSGEQIGPALQHKGPVNGAIFNKDETRILTWSIDSTARLWDAQSGEQIGPALQHKDDVRGAIFNKDETRILTWSLDGTARLWDAQSGEQIGPALQHKDDVWGASFNKDETRILTWSEDGTARLWDIGVDLDFPQDKFSLQIMALTGTEYIPINKEIKIIEQQRWQELKEKYYELARQHYKVCEYPRYNLWQGLFREEAEKIRPLKK